MPYGQANLACYEEASYVIDDYCVICEAAEIYTEGQLPNILHEVMVRNYLKDKVIGHISRDATAIEAREKPAKKPKLEPQPKRRGADVQKRERSKRNEKNRNLRD